MNPTTATVHGYTLHVPSYWTSVTPWQRKHYANGCGRASWLPALRAVLDSYSGFHAAADVHDIEWEWAGLEYISDRRHCIARYAQLLKESNERFYANCRAVVIADCRPVWRHPVCRIRGEFRARAFYRAVQLGAAMNVARLERVVRV